MSQYTEAVHTGFWIDYSRNSKIYASFLTLPNSHARVLLAFLVVVITFCANRSWKVARYLLHAALNSNNHQLRRGQQVILRNSETASSGLLSLLELAYDTPQNLGSVIGLSLFMLVHWLVFIGLGILTSQVVRGSVVQSAVTDTCGVWQIKGFDTLINYTDTTTYWVPYTSSATTANISTERQEFYLNSYEKYLNDTLNAENYVRNCYNTMARGIFECGRLITRSLPIHREWVACPFTGGDSLCDTPDSRAISLDSGNVTFDDLGINYRGSGDLSVGRRVVCAPLPNAPFRYSNASKLQELARLNITTPTVAELNDMYAFFQNGFGGNFTMLFGNLSAFATYNLQVYNVLWNASLPELKPRDPEQALVSSAYIFLTPGAVHTTHPSKDPWFTFTNPEAADALNRNTVLYGLTERMRVLACHEMWRMCSYRNNYCTLWRGAVDDYQKEQTKLDLAKLTKRPLKDGAAGAISSYTIVRTILANSDLLSSILNRGPLALLTTQTLIEKIQNRLPHDQWVRELENWFGIGLARLQLDPLAMIQIMPEMDEKVVVNTFNLPGNEKLKYMCGGIKFKSQGYTTMSTLGISVIIGAVIIFTLLSYGDVVLEHWFKTGWFATAVKTWESNEKLMLLRKLEQIKDEELDKEFVQMGDKK